MPVIFLVLFSTALAVGIGFVLVLLRRSTLRGRQPKQDAEAGSGPAIDSACALRWPGCWLAVKSRSTFAVQSALGLHNPKPCSWIRGLAGEEKLFIAPPVKGWVLVLGSGLPDPTEDADACFRFVLQLSRRLGQVQLFSANRVVHHHSWVMADSGRIQRAYAWAGKTVWTQGSPTPAEQELGMKCLDYLELPDAPEYGRPDIQCLNTEKLPMLAARWSIDPGRIDARFLQMERGIAGEPSLRY